MTRLAGRPPQPRSELVEHGRRIDDLYRRIKGADRPGPIVEDIPFSLAGALVATTSPPWTPRRGRLLAEVVALLGTAGSTSTVVTIYKNGVSIGTVTLTASTTLTTASFESVFSPSVDKLSVGVTTVGTSAADLVVIGRFL